MPTLQDKIDERQLTYLTQFNGYGQSEPEGKKHRIDVDPQAKLREKHKRTDGFSGTVYKYTYKAPVPRSSFSGQRHNLVIGPDQYWYSQSGFRSDPIRIISEENYSTFRKAARRFHYVLSRNFSPRIRAKHVDDDGRGTITVTFNDRATSFEVLNREPLRGPDPFETDRPWSMLKRQRVDTGASFEQPGKDDRILLYQGQVVGREASTDKSSASA